MLRSLNVQMFLCLGSALICVLLGACSNIKTLTLTCGSTLGCLQTKGQALQWYAAHRGAGTAYTHVAQNSVAAIQLSASNGIRLIEVDVRLADDGELFLFHDSKVQAKNLPMASDFAGKKIERLSPNDRQTLCRLSKNNYCPVLLVEALEAIKKYDSLLQLDIKGDKKRVIDQLVRLVKLTHQQEKILVQCPDLITLEYVRASYPQIPVLARIFTQNELFRSLKARPEIIQIDREMASSENIKLIHQHGSKILLKTLDSDLENIESHESLFAGGIDIILTDQALSGVNILPSVAAN